MSSETQEETARRRLAVSMCRERLFLRKVFHSIVRAGKEKLMEANKNYAKTEDDLNSLQSYGLLVVYVIYRVLTMNAACTIGYPTTNKVDKEKLTEAGMFAIGKECDYVIHEDFIEAVRKLTETKKLESSAHYTANFGKD